MRRRLKQMLRCAVVASAICLAAHTASAADSAQQAYKIEPQLVSTALKEFAAQSNMQLIFTETDVRNAMTTGVTGTRSPRDALSSLLKGTGLEFELTTNNVVVVRKARATRERDLRGSSDPSSDSRQGGQDDAARRLRMAQISSGTASDAPAASANASSSLSPGAGVAALSEIIVTAQKRKERLQDVPVPVSVLNAEPLAESNLVDIQDYYNRIPGLALAPGSQSTQLLSIRGITAGPGNPTVGVLIDDVPFTSSINLGGGNVVPDIDPGDLANVEVLRGPQGTLYGASSLGGLIKFVTVDPSTAGFSGRVQAGTEGIHNASGLGYDARGSVNVPINETLAVRMSAFVRQDPGYVDDPILHIDGVNKTDAYGGRLAALWKPNDTMSLKLSALYQDIRSDGGNDVTIAPGFGYLQQDYPKGQSDNKVVGAYDRQVQAYTATFRATIGNSELVALSGYRVIDINDSYDFSWALGPVAQHYAGVSGVPIYEHDDASKYTQEIRLSTPLGDRVDWLLGVFYTYEKSPWSEDIVAANFSTGAPTDLTALDSFPTMFSEYALFTDFTVKFTDQFDVQIGGRESWDRQTYQDTVAGPFTPLIFGAPTVVVPEEEAKANAFTYLLTPRLRLSPDLMLYARVASGYRAGGPNQPGQGQPSQYQPDKTNNYELGVKSDLLDRRLSIDLSLYDIDWKDIQLEVNNPTTHLSYFTNASAARSRGIELSVDSKPLTGLTVSGWVSLGDAELTSTFPPTATSYGVSGDALPYSSRFSASMSAQQRFNIGHGVVGFAGASLSYVGQREGVFTGTAERAVYPAYAKTDLTAGIDHSDWTLNLFANNVTNRYALLSGGLGSFPPTSWFYIQPRTIGVNISKAF